VDSPGRTARLVDQRYDPGVLGPGGGPESNGRRARAVFHWDYLEKTRPSDNGTVGWYILRVADIFQADRVANEIDALSTNSDHETLDASVFLIKTTADPGSAQ
jgi:hypothetical protein